VMWCIKEAVLKARRTGFHQSATSVDVLSLDLSDPRCWKSATVRLKDGARPEVHWRLSEDETLAMAIARIPAYRQDIRQASRS
jgi:phosphopantetheinyl transferase (holo-ACP synthase)